MQRIVGHPVLPENASSTSIKNLHDAIRESTLGLTNIGVDTSSWDPLMLHLLIKKLDRQSHILYEQSLKNPKEIQNISDFLQFLANRFQSLEALGGREKPNTSKAIASVAAASTGTKCSYCPERNHPLYYCPGFLKLSPSERLNWVQKQKLCFNCLKHDHSSKACSARSCTKCNKKHNSLLHLEPKTQVSKGSRQPATSYQQPSTEVKATASNASVTLAAANTLPARQGYVLLATAKVKITASNGQSSEFRAILDSGSQINLVTERLVKRLAITSTKAALCIEGIGQRVKNATQRVNIELHSRTSRFATRLEAFVLPSIVPAQPSQLFDISSWPIPENIQLADPEFHHPGKIDILLGAEFYFNLMTTGQIQLSSDLPVLQNTTLGWVFSGKLNNDSSNTATCAVYGDDEANTSALVQKFWKLDDADGADDNLTLAEKNCETHFVQTTRRNTDGRFVVKLPFADSPSALGESRNLALKRFLAIEKRMESSPQTKAHLKQQYVEFMQQYEALGHMTEIDPDDILHPHYFIPHHSVLKPESTTTKLRVVFDASAKTTSGLALNDIMYTGPTVQSDLFAILLRFRLPRFVFTTDIEKMYRQILIDPSDQMLQLIMWRKTQNEPIKYYKLNTVTYGTSSAPYLATKCLQQLAEKNIEGFPLGAQVLRDDFYVDDGISGSDSLATAVEMQKQLKSLLKGAGFNLRKWCSNHSQLLQGIPPEDQEVSLDFEDASIKTLGLTWMPKSDLFCVKASLSDNSLITKRTVISDIARIFDPLGLVGPVVITAKIFIQQIWQSKKSWDEQLPADEHAKWATFRHKLKALNDTRIPRHVFNGHKPTSTQMHTFVDASERAYGAAVYLRSRLHDGRIIVRLLCAKSRVAPLKMVAPPIKEVTIPHLELCAAVLGAELAARVKKELHLTNEISYFWSDSQIVLSWINSSASSLRTFVANRIIKIQNLSIKHQWRHVCSKDNPADVISRGLHPEKLMECNLWFYGPLFLHGPEPQWPKPFSSELHIPTDLERKQKGPTVAAATTSAGLEDIIYNIKHRNSFKVLQRVVAYMLRFIKNSKSTKELRTTDNLLTPLELDAALMVIIKTIQSSDFGQEIKQLRNFKEVDHSSPINSLHPFLDDKGLIRVSGRLGAATIPFDAKHQMLLPYNDPISKMILAMMHIDNRHCGPLALNAAARQRFWVIKGKSMARNIVKNCVRCTKARPRLLNQLMGSLPASRVQPARPFINSGVDFCGPFWIHFKARGKRPHKAYVAVFVCFATKAIHLEIVSDLTTEAFIGCLKRFIGRRGRCQNLYCDNATNFVGARNQLLELKEVIHTTQAQEAIVRTCSDKGIKFNFIPPRAPHFGGLWEAAVKSAKNLFVRSVSNASLTYEELETVMVEIEAILNSRPLTPMSEDPNDLNALTPGHFLIGEPLTAQIDTEAATNKASLLTRWKLVSHLKHEFWNRWSREYLNELQYRHKWKEQSGNVKPGMMVIIKEDNLPSLQWPLGRIIKIYKGPDNAVRVVDLQTSAGIRKRPIHRLAPLPLTNTAEEPPEHSSDITLPNEKVQTEEPVAIKRRKTSSSSINLMTIIAICLMLPIVLCSTVEIKRFNTNAGIHFEQLGSSSIISSEWNLVSYYDLQPLAIEIQALANGTEVMHHLCKQLQQKTLCEDIVIQFEHSQAELRLDNDLLAKPRPKRGAINVIGNVANSLFGVLDSEYAEKMSVTITAIKANEQHLLSLLKNQTSIIDSTINIIKRDQTNAMEAFAKFENKLSQIKARLRANEAANQDAKLFQMFISLALELATTASNIQRIQSSIINVLVNVHHGQISPLLLSPQQLKGEINNIIAHLPPTMHIPGYHENLLHLYKLMTVKGCITKRHAIFKITIPLSGPDQFDLYNLTPIPVFINNTMVAIKPSTQILAITLHRDRYFPTSIKDLQSCSIIEEQTYLCPNTHPIYNKGAKSCACEVSLFNNESMPLCDFKKMEDHMWIQTKKNHWIFAAANPIQVTAVCGKEVSHLSLNGSGSIHLPPECILKHELLTIMGNQVLSSVLNGSYTSFGGITELAKPDQLQPLLSDDKAETYTSQLKELAALQKVLSTQEIMNLPKQVESNRYHSIGIGYSALLLVVLVIIALVLKQKLSSIKPQRQPPTPQPRTRPLASDEDQSFEITF